MNTTLTIDTHGFDAFIEALVAVSGKPRVDVLLDQAARVLEICIQRSPDPFEKHSRTEVRKAVATRIQKPGRYINDSGTVVSARDNRVPRPIPYGTLQTLTVTRGGQRGGEWYIGQSRSGKRLIIHGSKMLGNEKFHRRQAMRDALFAETQPMVDRSVEAIGSLKASWYLIGRRIGAPLRKYPKWLAKVIPRKDDGAQSRTVIENTASFVELVNTAIITRYDGASILAGAVETRLKAFERAVKNDWFADLSYLAKNYPGLFTV